MRIFLAGLLLFISCLQAGAQTVGDSVAEFGFDYYQQVAGEGNSVVSPLSIHAAFSMLVLGSSCTSESQARTVLRLKPNFPSQYKVLIESLQPRKGKFSLASKVWPNQGFQLKKEFKSLCKLSFGAAPEILDFGQPEVARQTINSWVEKRTDGLIPELLPPGGIQRGTELALSNALFFEAEWKSGFRPGATRPGTFHTSGGEVQTPMMSGRVQGLHYRANGLEAVSLPYKGCPVAMLIAMPDSGLSEARPKLNKNLLSEVEMSAMKAGPVKMNLSMPKFTVSEASKPIPVLMKMGMTELLGPSPDLSRLAENSSGLRVGNSFHQAVVEVDENGTRAAAATVITVTRGKSVKVERVVIDRPFFFVLYHRSTLAPLFIGQVTDPTK